MSRSGRRSALVGGLSTVGFLIASASAWATGQVKLLSIVWVAFLGMALGGWLGSQTPQENTGVLVWGYGFASGAMVTSAAVFLLPEAVGHHPVYGGVGVAIGLLSGFAAHTLGHRLAHLDLPLDRTLAELTAHGVADGIIIGIIYGNMPALGVLLGLSIVSHKAPAGYAAVNRFTRRGGDWWVILLPAAASGIAAVASSFLALPASAEVRGVIFGFAAGVFLHVAMDFLPECEIGSEVHESLAREGDAHAVLDRMRVHAVVSTALGGLAVFLGWLIVA